MDFSKKYLNLKKLNRREKYIIYGAGCLLGLLIIVQFVVTPFFENRKQTQRSLKTKKVELEEMRRMQAEYAALKEKLQESKVRFSKREKGFTLFSFLDRLAGQAGIKDRISYMKPSKTVQKNSNYKISRVEMKLDAITLEQLATYLYGVETSKNMVMVKKVSISKKEKQQGFINVVLQVETVET
ncbi:MAG: type II secretion system protein GspM [Desulfobacterales bacterium]|jgi:general secretion pathway protein M